MTMNTIRESCTRDYIPASALESKNIRCAVHTPAPEHQYGKDELVARGLLFILSGRLRGKYWTPAHEKTGRSEHSTYLFHAHQVAHEEFFARTRYVHVNIGSFSPDGPYARISAKGKHVSDEEAQRCLRDAIALLNS